MRFLMTVAVLALMAPAAASANELQRVYDLALRNDPTLRAEWGARTQVVEGAPQARGQLLPQVNAFGGMGNQKNTYTIQGVEQPEEDTDYESLTLQLNQALFDATAWNRWQQAEAGADAARANYRIAQQDLVLRVAEAYFTLVGAADSVRFADAEKKAVERQLELAKKRFEVGLSAITDVQEAQARYDLTVAQMIEAEQILDIAKVLVTEITGEPGTRIVALREDIPLLGPAPDNVNDWLDASGKSNLSLAVAHAVLESAEQGVDLARAGHYPRLGLVGSLGNRTGSQFVPGQGTFDSETESTVIGLELTVPIFAGGSTQAGVRAAKGLREQRDAELEAQRRAVERATRNAYQAVVAGVARVKALKQAVVSNTTALEASEVGLEVGARTAVDVLNAQRELYRAERDHARARYDYLLNILRLKALAGQLMRKDLVEIDGLLVAGEPLPPPADTKPTAEAPATGG
jgi:outer membrane protein